MRGRWIILAAVVAVACGRATPGPPGGNRAAPETWDLWRAAPFSFPERMAPQVPEAVAGSALAFGRDGEALAIVVPEGPAADYDARALRAMVRLIAAKVPRATVVRAGELTPALEQRHLLVVGTAANNAFGRTVLARAGEAGAPPLGKGGYRLRTVDSPFAAGRKIILALGADPAGAWPAAALLAYSIHPQAKGLTAIKAWPVPLPDGIYWSPFRAECPRNDDAVPLPDPATPPATRPSVPFGVRIWGSPMPTLGSYQRLMRALRGLGVDTVALQSGGWPDLPDAPDRFRAAVGIAAQEGLSTILYVGNDLVAHRPAPLTANHRAIVLATKDLPGLLEFHVYNQLAADLTPAERALVEEQVRWLRRVSSKRIGMEVVWGHDAVAMPPAKAALLADLKRWGVDVIANDDAPIGGWSRAHRTAIWEPRLRELAALDLPVEAVIQAHVPFVDPTIPTAADVRSQFWWAAAGGARGFLIEAAYLFTSLSNRGLLSWDLRPEPDGRADEVRRLAGIARAVQPFTSAAVPESAAGAAGARLEVSPKASVALRLYRTPAGGRFALLINPSTRAPARASLRAPAGMRVRELAPGGALHATGAGPWQVDLAPGDGVCLELTSPPP